ncbi:Calx-beta domain-containing protein, partial [Geminocystis sp. CENA526]|uniref:Calx-beta domain-containing protein n=1 Tax=Geminocystis sp. CENA526 TaxID=1355871 RepID=UPI003D6FDD47
SLTVTQLSPTNTITVVMDAHDTLNLSSDFSLNGTVYQYNQKFDRYTSNTSSATVLLNRIVATTTETSQLVLTEEGSLVLLSESGEQLWTAEKNGVQVTGAVQALMQTDGNFVLYNQVQPTNQPGLAQYALWASGTNNNDSGTYLQLGGDGGLYIKTSTGQILSTLNSGNPNISDTSRLNEQQELLKTDSISATFTQIGNAVNVTNDAPSYNTPEPIATTEVTASSFNSEMMTSFSVDESGNEIAQSFASSFFSATASNPNAPTRIFVSNPTANEADGEVSFTIQRTGDLDKYVQVHYITQDGRGKAGSDYNSVLGRAVFKPGETTKTVSVPLILDDVYT